MPDDLSGWGSDRDAELPFERRLDRLGWRIDSLDRWRRDVDHRLSACEDGLDAVTKAQEIAAAVAHELQARADHGEPVSVQPVSSFGLTWWQKLGGIIAGAIILAGELKGLLP